MSTIEPITIIAVSYNRPLYLWACLDSIYRHTKYPYRLFLSDNNSSDPLVRNVLTGFERRGIFEKLTFCDDNHPDRFNLMLRQYIDRIGEFIVMIDTDITFFPTSPCWLERLVNHMRCDHKLGALGSLIDTSDFVDIEDARRIYPDFNEPELNHLTKWNSPERTLKKNYKESIIRPILPGRVIIARTETLAHTPVLDDRLWNAKLKQLGYQTGIATDVCHRHLSLLNIYDYHEYSKAERDTHMYAQIDEEPITGRS
jgi:glycosyltransferase involved in cell wall biosynthesis